MDYMIFFAIWIIGGIAFFLANRVKPVADDSTSTDEGDDEDSGDGEDSGDDAEESESEESSDEAD